MTVFYPAEKTCLFIDGANLYAAAKALNFDIDYWMAYDIYRYLACPLDIMKCQSNLALMAKDEKRTIQTYPIYGSTLCFWNITSDLRN